MGYRRTASETPKITLANLLLISTLFASAGLYLAQKLPSPFDAPAAVPPPIPQDVLENICQRHISATKSPAKGEAADLFALLDLDPRSPQFADERGREGRQQADEEIRGVILDATMRAVGRNLDAGPGADRTDSGLGVVTRQLIVDTGMALMNQTIRRFYLSSFLPHRARMGPAWAEQLCANVTKGSG